MYISENYFEKLNGVNVEPNIRVKIIEFFKNNPNPSDKQIHNFAELDLSIEPNELETHIYRLLTELINKKLPGKHNHIPDNEFNQEQLKMGIRVEMEHSEDVSVAKSISKDHLSEKGLENNYYTLLQIMEEKAKEII